MSPYGDGDGRQRNATCRTDPAELDLCGMLRPSTYDDAVCVNAAVPSYVNVRWRIRRPTYCEPVKHRNDRIKVCMSMIISFLAYMLVFRWGLKPILPSGFCFWTPAAVIIIHLCHQNWHWSLQTCQNLRNDCTHCVQSPPSHSPLRLYVKVKRYAHDL